VAEGVPPQVVVGGPGRGARQGSDRRGDRGDGQHGREAGVRASGRREQRGQACRRGLGRDIRVAAAESPQVRAGGHGTGRPGRGGQRERI
jgi:hypothetical protein